MTRPEKRQRAAGLLVAAAGLLACLAWYAGDRTVPASASDFGADLPDAASTTQSAAMQELRSAIASANVVTPFRIRSDGQRIVISGVISGPEHERLAEVASRTSSRFGVPIKLEVAAEPGAGDKEIAAVMLRPTASVTGRNGQRYVIGDQFVDGWRITTIDASGIGLTRGDARKLIALPARR